MTLVVGTGVGVDVVGIRVGATVGESVTLTVGESVMLGTTCLGNTTSWMENRGRTNIASAGAVVPVSFTPLFVGSVSSPVLVATASASLASCSASSSWALITFVLNSTRNSSGVGGGSSPGSFPCGHKQTSRASCVLLRPESRKESLRLEGLLFLKERRR